MKAVPWLIGVLTAVNFILFVLTFVPAFSGIGVGPHPGLADRLWGDYRFGGWRADIVWVITSTAGILILALPYSQSTSAKRTRARKLVLASCAVWLVCFLVYARYVLMHMMG
jgi:hypothetical protein